MLNATQVFYTNPMQKKNLNICISAVQLSPSDEVVVAGCIT